MVQPALALGSGFTPAAAGYTAVDDAWPEALAPLAGLLDDPAVTDVVINGGRGVYADRGAGLRREHAWSPGEAETRALAIAVIAAGGRHIDEATPCADARIGRVRAHAVLPPIARSGTVLSLRLAAAHAPSLDRLHARGMFSGDARLLGALRGLVASRVNVLVAGGTGTGKTTLLGAMLAEADPNDRIVTIEDVAELQPAHPHHISLETRQANLEGAGAVSPASLLREALRMRPDRIVVGECRGAEVRELLSALNTGHEGGGGTLHANALDDVPARLEALGALAGLGPEALARQAASAIGAVVHLERTAQGQRRVAAIGALRVTEGRLDAVAGEVPAC